MNLAVPWGEGRETKLHEAEFRSLANVWSQLAASHHKPNTPHHVPHLSPFIVSQPKFPALTTELKDTTDGSRASKGMECSICSGITSKNHRPTQTQWLILGEAVRLHPFFSVPSEPWIWSFDLFWLVCRIQPISKVA